jgi:5'-3' exonuclease
MKQMLNIVDGNFFVNFASHSGILNLRGPKGQPTGALHTFLNTLWAIKQKNHGNLVVVFDGGRAVWRNQLYPGYKKKDKRVVSGNLDTSMNQIFTFEDFELSESNLTQLKKDITEVYNENSSDAIDEICKIIESLELTDKEFKRVKGDFEFIFREEMKSFTFNTLYRLLPQMGIPMVRIPDQEADDVIYVLVKQTVDKYSVYCITSDEDFVQMTRLGATVLLYRQDEILTAGNFDKKYKFPLNAFTLYKALKGDASDKIGGVPGIGEVNAVKIIQALKEPTIECLIDLVTDSKNKKYQAVLENLKIVKRNMRLMDLEYIELEEDIVADYYEDALDKAVLNFPYVKKVINDLGLQHAGTKWLAELSKNI